MRWENRAAAKSGEAFGRKYMRNYEKAPYRMIQGCFRGAVSGNRTRTVLLPRDFKSLVSTNSTMTANFVSIIIPNTGGVVNVTDKNICSWHKAKTQKIYIRYLKKDTKTHTIKGNEKGGGSDGSFI